MSRNAGDAERNPKQGAGDASRRQSRLVVLLSDIKAVCNSSLASEMLSCDIDATKLSIDEVRAIDENLSQPSFFEMISSTIGSDNELQGVGALRRLSRAASIRMHFSPASHAKVQPNEHKFANSSFLQRGLLSSVVEFVPIINNESRIEEEGDLESAEENEEDFEQNQDLGTGDALSDLVNSAQVPKDISSIELSTKQSRKPWEPWKMCTIFLSSAYMLLQIIITSLVGTVPVFWMHFMSGEKQQYQKGGLQDALFKVDYFNKDPIFIDTTWRAGFTDRIFLWLYHLAWYKVMFLFFFPLLMLYYCGRSFATWRMYAKVLAISVLMQESVYFYGSIYLGNPWFHTLQLFYGPFFMYVGFKLSLPRDSKVPKVIIALFVVFASCTLVFFTMVYTNMTVRIMLIIPLLREVSRYLTVGQAWHLAASQYILDKKGVLQPRRELSWLFYFWFQVFSSMYSRMTVANLNNMSVLVSWVAVQAVIEIFLRTTMRKRDAIVRLFFAALSDSLWDMKEECILASWRAVGAAESCLHRDRKVATSRIRTIEMQNTSGTRRTKRHETTLIDLKKMMEMTARKAAKTRKHSVSVLGEAAKLEGKNRMLRIVQRRYFISMVITCEMLAEYVGIFSTAVELVLSRQQILAYPWPFFTSTEQPFDKVTSDDSLAWLIRATLVQGLGEIVADLICCFIEQKSGLDLIWAWKNRPRMFIRGIIISAWFGWMLSQDFIAAGLPPISNCPYGTAVDLCLCNLDPSSILAKYCKYLKT